MPAATKPARSRGFTAIELAMILAVTAVIGAVGVSAYRTYAVRAEIVAGVILATPLREAVERTFRSTGVPPANRDALIVHSDESELSNYVEAMRVVDGRIEIEFGRAASAAIAGRTLSLTPFEAADLRVVWICGNRIPGVGLEPLGFAGGAAQAVQVLTTIDPRYLPSACR